MADKLTKFILELSEDPAVLAEFKRQPKEVMERQGLSMAERAVLLSADPATIRNAVDPEAFGFTVTIVVVAIIIFESAISED